MDAQDFQREMERVRADVQEFVEAQAASGVSAWALAGALGEKAVQVLHHFHGRDEALRLLDGLRALVEAQG